ncbi:MAG: SoxR reducing system RseC family protein, partial [Oscillospiraceae bacterium]|nr:SoxR reducing system RseC family protein [Oscillospiraceae bacterium]
GAVVGQKVVVESSTRRLLGIMAVVYILPFLLFFVGYFATPMLSEGLRYAAAIALFILGVLPAVLYDRHLKKSGELSFVIIRPL